LRYIRLTTRLAAAQLAAAGVKKMKAAQKYIQKQLQTQSEEEQNIQAEQNAGLLTEYSARQRILTLHRETAAAIEKELPALEELVHLYGKPVDAEALKRLKVQLHLLKIQANDLVMALKSGFESGLEEALQGLATGTETLGQAWKQLTSSILSSLARIAAQAIASKIVMAFSGKNTDVGTGAVKLGVASVTLAAGSMLLGTNAEQLQIAADTLLTATIASSAASFAEGGWTGPGGKYQIAGIVHAGEYVQPAARMSEPGALDLMNTFRRLGMRALSGLGVPGYSGGGSVVPVVPDIPLALPLRSVGVGGRGSVPVPVINQRIVVGLDSSALDSWADSSGFENAVKVVIRDNPSYIRQSLNG